MVMHRSKKRTKSLPYMLVNTRTDKIGTAMRIWLVHPADTDKPQVMCIGTYSNFMQAFPSFVLGFSPQEVTMKRRAHHVALYRADELIAKAFICGTPHSRAIPGIIMVGENSKDVYDQQSELIALAEEVTVDFANEANVCPKEKEKLDMWAGRLDSSRGGAAPRRLTAEDKVSIKKELTKGGTLAAIAADYEVAPSTIGRVRSEHDKEQRKLQGLRR